MPIVIKRRYQETSNSSVTAVRTTRKAYNPDMVAAFAKTQSFGISSKPQEGAGLRVREIREIAFNALPKRLFFTSKERVKNIALLGGDAYSEALLKLKFFYVDRKACLDMLA